jgi:hypothetical protein
MPVVLLTTMKNLFMQNQIILPFLIGMILLSGSVVSCQNEPPNPPPKLQPNTSLIAAAQTIPATAVRTLVTPHLNQVITAGQNLVWSATLQLAWNELLAFAGGEVTMEQATPLVATLNGQTIKAADLRLPPKSYVATAGIVNADFLKTLRQAVAPQLQATVLKDVEALPPERLLAYAYLTRTLPFEWAFKRFEQPFEFDETPVATFGLKQYLVKNANEQKLAQQVVILDYRSDADYILELRTTTPAERIILAKLTPAATLTETVNAVLARMKNGTPAALQNLETLIIPVIKVDKLQQYPELCGRKMHAPNAAVNGKQFGMVAQYTQFTLDETGARLESKTIAFSAKSPRQFIFDQPFLVLLLRQDAPMPYLAVWIANAELLTPFE